MEQQLLTANLRLYSTGEDRPCTMRLAVRMRDLINEGTLRRSVEKTMRRYPYFCVRLDTKKGQFVFVENDRPVVVLHGRECVPLGGDEANGHLVAFSWFHNWIFADMYHALTDGFGIYSMMRTLLYYYCSARYNVELLEEGINLLGDEIEKEEWIDPVSVAEDIPEPMFPVNTSLPPSFDLMSAGKTTGVGRSTVFSIVVPEKEFMRFSSMNDGSPGTIVSLFLSRAIVRLHPDADVLRTLMCVNQRPMLNAAKAHQSLVGYVTLDYGKSMRSWSLDRQATAYRGMVMLQADEKRVKQDVAWQARLVRHIKSIARVDDRVEFCKKLSRSVASYATASISYVGKANYKDSERYIRDFRSVVADAMPVFATPILIEIAAINGKFYMDFIQKFSGTAYLEAFVAELEENDLVYDVQDVGRLRLSKMKVPWMK